MLSLLLLSFIANLFAHEYRWKTHVGHEYYFGDALVIYDQARRLCLSMNSQLVEIYNVEIQEFLQTTVNEFAGSSSPHTRQRRNAYWIGLRTSSFPPNFTFWNSSEPVTFTKWGDREPSADQYEDCVAMGFPFASGVSSRQTVYGYSWFNIDCAGIERKGVVHHPSFICQRRKTGGPTQEDPLWYPSIQSTLSTLSSTKKLKGSSTTTSNESTIDVVIIAVPLACFLSILLCMVGLQGYRKCRQINDDEPSETNSNQYSVENVTSTYVETVDQTKSNQRCMSQPEKCWYDIPRPAYATIDKIKNQNDYTSHSPDEVSAYSVVQFSQRFNEKINETQDEEKIKT